MDVHHFVAAASGWALVLALGGCGAPENSESGSSPWEFTLDGTDYGVSCIEIKAKAVSDEVLGRALLDGNEKEVRRIKDVSPDVVAVAFPAVHCMTKDDTMVPWTLASREGGDSVAIRRAYCKVAVRTKRGTKANGC